MSEVILTPTASEIEEIPGTALREMSEPGWSWDTLQLKQRPQFAWLIRDERGESVSILRIFYRMLVCKQRQLRAVGIGGVWTWPARRGQGYAYVLLNKAMPKLIEFAPSADIVVLYASKERSLYSRLGFSEISEGLYGKAIHPFESFCEDLDWKLNPEGHF